MIWMSLLLSFASANPLSEEAQRAYDALAPRHVTETCEALTTRLSLSGKALEEVVERVQSPPWAPMRAAECLLQTKQASEGTLSRWVSNEQTRGLARLVFTHLESWPVHESLPIARAALSGQNRALVLPILERSLHVELRELIDVQPME